MENIKEIAVNELEPHPDNPRLFLREDVIDGIAAQLQETGCFDPAHALLVRPQNGHFQIVRGHHRWKAAEKAKFDAVPCWVREMSDEEAYMQLALGNVQGELSPLEIGVHALKVEDRGLRRYARQISKDASHIASYRQGAEVLQYIKCGDVATLYVNKANHLAVIYNIKRRELWPLLAQWLITPEDDPKKQPSVKQTKELIKQISKFNISHQWQYVFLPMIDVVASFIKTGKPSPEQVKELITSAKATQALIRAHAKTFGRNEFAYSLKDFCLWLRDGIGSYAWDKFKIDEYRQKVIEAAQKAAKPPEPDVKQGEWYRLGEHLLYCGDTSQPEFWHDLPQASFAFADPPYNAGVDDWDKDFKWQHDWLIEKAPIVAVTPGIESIQDFYKEQTGMPHAWAISAWIKNGMTRGRMGYGNWIYIGVFAQAEESIYRQAQDHLEVTVKTSNTEQSDHPGRKPPELMQKLIELFTEHGDTVIDPFLGSGTTLFEADKLGRACVGGEIKEDFCNDIISRWQDETGQAAERIKKEEKNPL